MEFTKEQKMAIIEYQDSVSMQDMAEAFCCTPLEVYECYDCMLYNGEYEKYYVKQFKQFRYKFKREEDLYE